MLGDAGAGLICVRGLRRQQRPAAAEPRRWSGFTISPPSLARLGP